jgi:hypothetical protein
MKNRRSHRTGLSILLLLASLAKSAAADQGVRDWEALPEDPAMREVCSTDLKYSTEIEMLEARGATIVPLLRWAEQQSEITAKNDPSDQVMPIGTELVLMHLIQRSIFDRPIYSQIRGGFPQWIYRSCLKGKPIDQ